MLQARASPSGGGRGSGATSFSELIARVVDGSVVRAPLR